MAQLDEQEQLVLVNNIGGGLHDARLAAEFAEAMLARGVYVVAFSYPVVPQGEARIRVQVSAAHETDHLDRAVAAFTKVGKQLGVLS